MATAAVTEHNSCTGGLVCVRGTEGMDHPMQPTLIQDCVGMASQESAGQVEKGNAGQGEEDPTAEPKVGIPAKLWCN